MTEESVEQYRSEHVAVSQIHWLQIAGIWIFIIALIGAISSVFIPHALPNIADTKFHIPEMLDVDPVWQSALLSARLHALTVWVSDRLLFGGFFMWLAGCLISELRRLSS